MKTVAIYIFFLIHLCCFAQQPSEIDSLKQVIKTSKNDSVIMVSYSKLRRATSSFDPKVSQNYTFEYLKYAEKLKDTFHIGIANYYLGNSYVTEGDFEMAFKYYFKSANYFERTKDSSRLSSIFNGIGAAYENNGNDSLSLKYFKLSRNISKSLGDFRRSGIAANNISNIYKNRGDLVSAISYLEEGLAELEDPKFKPYYIPTSINLANAYSDHKEFDKAMDIYSKTLNQLDTLNDIYNYSSVLRGLGNIELAKSNYKKSVAYLKKAFDKNTENGFLDERYSVMKDLIEAYHKNGEDSKGLALFYEYNTIKDSIFNTEKDKNLTEALQKYETEKKDVQLKLLKVEAEKKEQQKQLYLFATIAGLILASALGILFYKNRKKKLLLAKQTKLLEASIDEKNILLKETHHRVKNSFQIVSSLLYLQSENMEDKEAKVAIKEAENRVRSMVLIHQKLYNKDQLVGIDSKEYFTDLVHDIFESHQFQEHALKYQLDVDSLVLDVETITPIGLILNELIVNVLKHAFPKVERYSLLKINFKRVGNSLVLKVIDNGKGFENDIKDTSFGIKLMNALSKKLKAELQFNSEKEKGTEATLNIKKFNIL